MVDCVKCFRKIKVLGPLLFLIYINDINNCTSDSEFRLFADDTANFKHHANLNILMEQATYNMNKIKRWQDLNKLSLNIPKTCFSIYHLTRHNIGDQYNSIKVGGMTIHRVQTTKYLGTLIDEKLTWKPHIEHVMKSLIKYFGIFYKLRDPIPEKFRRQIYYAYIIIFTHKLWD